MYSLIYSYTLHKIIKAENKPKRDWKAFDKYKKSDIGKGLRFYNFQTVVSKGDAPGGDVGDGRGEGYGYDYYADRTKPYYGDGSGLASGHLG